MSNDELQYQSIAAVAPRIAAGELSPVDLTEHHLERITALDGRLKSFATVTADRARAAAKQAQEEIAAGRYRGPLHGIPVAVKDLCYTKGIPTMGGLAVRRDFLPDFDATVIERLDAAGAVLLGKLNLTEGAMAGYHPDFDIPVNPWGEGLWPGASSSGSGVAAAAGLCYCALGSDTGGSIRFPALANGVVGFKPTYGRVSRHGVLDLGETLDHVGPLARYVEDAVLVLRAIAGQDPADPTSLAAPVPDFDDLDAPIDGLRMGYDPQYARAGTDPELVAAIEQALEVFTRLGANVVEVKAPEDILDLGDLWFAICAFEAHQAHAEHFPSRRDEYGPYFRDFLEMGANVTTAQYDQAMTARAAFNARYLAVLDGVDALLCPSGGITFPAGDDQYGDAETLAPLFGAVQMHFTIPADFAGAPTLTVPCGVSGGGLPLALQLVGAPLSEATLARLGRAYERATEWHLRHPPV